MRRLGCLRCAGSAMAGFLCEEHPHLPWEHDGCRGAGINCPVCNPNNEVEWLEVYATTDPARDGEPTPSGTT